MVSLNLEKVGLFVLIAILVGGLATSPVFSSSYSAFAQSDDADVEQDAMDEAEPDEMSDESSDEMDEAEHDEMELDERDEIECREGLNLVMMHSNGKAMCMKSSTAEKLIDRGIVVPA